MQQQRTHGEDAATRRGAHEFWAGKARCHCSLGSKPAKCVRARHHPKRPVVLGTVIQVNAQGQKSLKNAVRRLNKECALFLRPAPQAGVLNMRCDRNA